MAIDPITSTDLILTKIEAGKKIEASDEYTRFDKIREFSESVSTKAVNIDEVQTINALKKFAAGISLESKKITNLGDPEAQTDAVNLKFVETNCGYLKWFMQDVFTGRPPGVRTFSTVDLSEYVGARRAIVLLRAQSNYNSYFTYAVVPDDATITPPNLAHEYGGSCWSSAFWSGSGHDSLLLTFTSPQGKVKHWVGCAGGYNSSMPTTASLTLTLIAALANGKF